MPRLPPSLIQQAFRRHPLLPLLLRECRDINSAQNELRWLTEHASAADGGTRSRGEDVTASGTSKPRPKSLARAALYANVLRRSRGEPLQYVLGTQPFGDLEILCSKGVLIPRPETEEYTRRLAVLVRRILEDNRAGTGSEGKLRLLDLCTGTGCIALLLHSLLKSAAESRGLILEIVAVDISDTALRLCKDNLQHNIRNGALDVSAGNDISFVKLDILKDACEVTIATFDIVIANPPYISPTQYAPGGTTARSVRLFEPKLALVPPAVGREEPPEAYLDQDDNQADTFYPVIYKIAEAVNAQVLVMEVGDSSQARRVANRVSEMSCGKREDIEMWRDGEDSDEGRDVRAGWEAAAEDDEAHGRAVVAWRGRWAAWRSDYLATASDASLGPGRT